ncbi:MAG: SRPBCC family protein [Myxococcota bacterium]
MVELLLLSVLEARAAEPPPITPTSTGDGGWRTEIVVPVPVATVRAALADPIASARFSPDISSIAYVARGTTCETLRAETAGIATIAYDYRRCATADGWHETLVSSEGLDAYEVRWQLVPVEGGPRVSYQVKVDTSFPAPEFVMTRAMKTSITTLLARLYRAVTV